MRLLICTQTVDRHDSHLGFFHRWIEELATKAEDVVVICLNEGGHSLPRNVRVYSLGKEKRVPRLRKLVYAVRFLRRAWRLRNSYDTVFVHMNQEYVLLGGPFWKLLGKKVYLWRNHYAGSLATDLAALFCAKIFYTSRASYTARYTRSVRMSVGVDVDSARTDVAVRRVPRSILFLARLDESKRPHLLLEALGLLHSRGVPFSATIVGGPSDPNSPYPARLKTLAQELSVAEHVLFAGPVPNTETFRYYRSHDVFVNCSPSGMLDKTIFKAVVCGCVVLASSRDFGELVGEGFIFADNNPADLAQRLEEKLSLSEKERAENVGALQGVITNNTVEVLIERLGREMKPTT